jgi:two-component system response regulator GlrR
VRFLIAAPWRGNVRELENLIEKAVILAEGDRLDGAFLESLLPPTARPSQGEWQRARGTHGGVVVVAAPESETAPGSRAPRVESARTLAEFDEAWLAAERAYLEDLVKSSGGNLAEASRRAQVRNRNTLISRLKRHGIGKRKDGDGPVEGGSDPT